VAGLGEPRREYHRRAVADKLRELRGRNGWTQEDLADQLGIDRRQVVRLETRRVPVTLEIVEALARAFGELSITFMWSVMDDEDVDVNVAEGWVRRFAKEEFRHLFGAAAERPGVTSLMHTAMDLTDDDLTVVGQVADAFNKARALTDSEADEHSFLSRSMFPAVRDIESTKPRAKGRVRQQPVGKTRPREPVSAKPGMSG
jgi:transcriptional regulator with XRE-family HTH domain